MTDRYSGQRTRPKLGLDPAAFTEEMLSWEFVDSRMRAALNYWIASAGTDGRPHVVPVWGAWLNDLFYFVGGGRKIRNFRTKPQAVVHLESADEVVIIEGRFEEVSRRDPQFMQRLDEDFGRKYTTYRPSEHLDNPDNPTNAPEGLFAISPLIVLAWSGFAHNATRWRIPAID